MTVTFDLLATKSNQLIFVPNCHRVVNLVKFPLVFCKVSFSQIFTTGPRTHGHADSPHTECLQQLIASECVTGCVSYLIHVSVVVVEVVHDVVVVVVEQ